MCGVSGGSYFLYAFLESLPKSNRTIDTVSYNLSDASLSRFYPDKSIFTKYNNKRHLASFMVGSLTSRLDRKFLSIYLDREKEKSHNSPETLKIFISVAFYNSTHNDILIS